MNDINIDHHVDKNQILFECWKTFKRLKKTDRYFKKIMPKICHDYPEIPELALKIWKTEREPFVEKFKEEKFISTCSSCQQNCCRGQHYKNLFKSTELLLFYSLPKQINTFNWPTPNWEYLDRKSIKRFTYATDYWHRLCSCLFLGPKGCLLKEWRPRVCLVHVCDKIRKIIANTEKEAMLGGEASETRAEIYKQFSKTLLKTPLHPLFESSTRFSTFGVDITNRGNYDSWDEFWKDLQKNISAEL